jgi:alkylmercury lyase
VWTAVHLPRRGKEVTGSTVSASAEGPHSFVSMCVHLEQSNPWAPPVYASPHSRPTVQEVLLSEGLTTSDKILMRLPGATLAIRRAAFRTLATSGRQVTIEEAAAIAGLDAETALEAAELIASVGMAEIDEGTIVGMDGLTTRPTKHRMLLDGVSIWTWCAYDIVGIAAALRADAVGETACGWCGKGIEIIVRAGVPAPNPAIGWLPRVDCSNVRAEFCPSALLFCSREHLDAWRSQTHADAGEPMTVAGLAEQGRIGWRELVA